MLINTPHQRRKQMVVTKTLKFKCSGNGPDGISVLDQPLDVEIELTGRRGERSISVRPKGCPHNTGGHGHRCKASQLEQHGVRDKVLCPLAFDYPYATSGPGWTMPGKLGEAVEQLIEELMKVSD
jgi:hypothetical protein